MIEMIIVEQAKHGPGAFWADKGSADIQRRHAGDFVALDVTILESVRNRLRAENRIEQESSYLIFIFCNI